MEELIKNHFDFIPTDIKTLWGYDNSNFLVTTDKGKYIFKTYLNNSESFDLINAECELLEFVNNSKGIYPKPIKFKDNSLIKILKIDGEERICRMLSYLKGDFLGDARPTESIYKSLGKTTAELDLKLQSFNNYTIKARRWKWDLQYLHMNDKHIQDIPDASKRSLVEYYLQQYDENIYPHYHSLRKSIIHGDVNEWNVLVKNTDLSGIIDFGDICYTPLINELAIAVAYAILYVEEHVKWSGFIVESYNKVLPLKEEEIALLYYLIPTRLCISVCNSAYERKINPKNTYTAISEKLAWQLLQNWLKVNPIELKNVYRKLCGFDKVKPSPIEKVVSDRHSVMSSNLSISYDEPILVTRSAFQYMYDAYGNTYLDAYNNIPLVGHSHPRVVKAGQKQMAKLNTNTRYIYDILYEYADKLLSKFPEQLDRVFFVNSGSAASDLAIRMAKSHTGYKNIMVMEYGYHGNTQTAMDISDYKFSAKLGTGQKENILKTSIPDVYRGKYHNTNAGKQFAQNSVNDLKSFGKPIAAFISEPIVGCGGQIPLAKGYLKELYPVIRQQGGICISDEVQTGFGRLGKHFWGFEAHNVVPDIVIIGKPMGNGHPMAAVITTEAVSNSFCKGVEYFSSFGGNPVSCAIGLEVLKVLEEERLQENAGKVGNYYISQLKELQTKHECIGDIRGAGLFLGIDIVKNRIAKIPDTLLANFIKNEFRNRKILLGTDGAFNNVIKTKPPLCFNKDEVDQVVSTLDEILRDKI